MDSINIKKKNTEILAPCGDYKVLESAICTGANAVYLAGKSYGARAFAGNFTDEEMVKAIKLAHLFNVKVYVTINTVLFEDEIDDCIKYIDFLYLNDVDALIIQDLGLSSIIKERYPDLKIHASTQMNAQTVNDVITLKRLGFSRVILGREVSLDVIKEIKEKVDIEVEVFIHGALCISYSGNCFFSLLVGGRSGNRGKCAQPCRLLHKFMGKEKYYLSPRDLCTIDNINEISEYVDSLKIEGRMKSKEYVYHVVKAYSFALNKQVKESKNELIKAKIAFNREYTKGFINNETNSLITNVNSSNHLGLLIGKIIRQSSIGPNYYDILLSYNLDINDSIRIVGTKTDAIICNAMYKCERNTKELIKHANSGEIVSLKLHQRMNIGDEVYLTKREEDIYLTKENQENLLFNDERKIDLTAKCFLDEYKDLNLSISDGENIVSGIVEYEKSENDLSSRICEQINKTGGTPFKFTKIEANIPNIYVKVKEINTLRRDLFEELILKREKRYNRTNKNIIKNDQKGINQKNISSVKESDIEYSFVINTSEQLEKIKELYDHKINYKVYGRNGLPCDYNYLPRVENIEKLNNIEKEQNRFVSSSLGTISYISSIYMNITNSYSVKVLEDLGVKKIGLSLELSKDNIRNLIRGFNDRYGHIPNVEVMVYGYYQMMYMKHCFVNKELGYNKLHCQACKKTGNDKLMIDDYPLFGDENCHMAILYKEPVNLCGFMDELKRMGVKNFLFDYTVESKDQIKDFNYLKLIANAFYGRYKLLPTE